MGGNVMSKLEKLLTDYEQACQNFNYADTENVNEAIQKLCELEYFIKKEKEK
jgi:hypothetical protein